jgi:uncharacterized protein
VLICDTGPLAAALSQRDSRHEECSALLKEFAGQIAAPAPVVTETALFVLGRLGPDAQGRFLDSVAAGEIDVLDLEEVDHGRVAGLCRRYADLPLDQVDASVIVFAERLGERRVASLDVRHLGVVRLADGNYLELLPGAA